MLGANASTSFGFTVGTRISPGAPPPSSAAGESRWLSNSLLLGSELLLVVR